MSNNILTPYSASKIVNGVLKDQGIEKVLPPQMFYNYTTARVRQGKTPFIPMTDGGIKESDLEEWIKKYINKIRNKK